MGGSFEESFKSFIDERINNNYCEVVHCNPEYQKYIKQIVEIHQTILKKLGPENSRLIIEYESLKLICIALQLNATYILGFKDGILLQQMLETAC